MNTLIYLEIFVTFQNHSKHGSNSFYNGTLAIGHFQSLADFSYIPSKALD